MAFKIPFTIYIKITPEYGNGKRFEIQRSRERIAHLVHLDLSSLNTIAMASPGGGGTWGLAEDTTSLSNLVEIVAVKPQFGQDPDILTVVGFYNAVPKTPYPEITLINAGEYKTGPASGAPGWRSNLEPTSDSRTAVKNLKTAVSGAITSVTVDIIKIELSGITYGRGGYHFPL